MDGIADAAAWGSAVSILMKLFPSKVTTVMSWTETLFGFGYMIGEKSRFQKKPSLKSIFVSI